MQPNGLWDLRIVGLGTIEGKGINFAQSSFWCAVFYLICHTCTLNNRVSVTVQQK